MALWLAWQESPVALVELSNRLQIEKSAAEALLEGLAQVGLVQVSRRSYDLIQKERKSNGGAWQTILALLEKEGQVTRRSVMKALNIGKKQAEYLLKTWVEGGKLILEGKGRSAHYILKLRKNSE
jgi:predicted transcriptional regulator